MYCCYSSVRNAQGFCLGFGSGLGLHTCFASVHTPLQTIQPKRTIDCKIAGQEESEARAHRNNTSTAHRANEKRDNRGMPAVQAEFRFPDTDNERDQSTHGSHSVVLNNHTSFCRRHLLCRLPSNTKGFDIGTAKVLLTQWTSIGGSFDKGKPIKGLLALFQPSATTRCLVHLRGSRHRFDISNNSTLQLRPTVE